MFAKVESGSVKELLKGNKGFIVNNNQYFQTFLHYGQRQREMLLAFIQ